MKTLKVTEKEVQQMSKKGSRLAPFKEEIVVMINMKVSSSSISKWLLKKHKVVSSAQNISDYYNRHKNSVDMNQIRFPDDNTDDPLDTLYTLDMMNDFLDDDNFDDYENPNHEA